MNKYFAKYLFLLPVYVLLQALILNQILFSSYINPFLYVILIIGLPIKTPKWFLLIYAFLLGFFSGIVDITTIYRTLPLIIILPIGVFIGDKFFVKSKEETYRKVVFYFLILISIFGIFRIISSF